MAKALNILVVDDSRVILNRLFQQLNELEVVSKVAKANNFQKALEVLAQEQIDVALLDINLPKINGLEVLTAIKTHPELRVVPVIMLTTSESEKDIMQSYYHHANCFITKPVNFSNFIEVIHSLKEFWISIVHLPNPPQQNEKI